MTELSLSNEDMVAKAVIGQNRDLTVTPANPSPPTNISSIGETPPHTGAVVLAARSDWGTAEWYLDPSNDMDAVEMRRPKLAASPAPAPRVMEDYGNPNLFAAETDGLPPEAFGTEQSVVSANGTVTRTAGVERYAPDPNLTHPSNPVIADTVTNPVVLSSITPVTARLSDSPFDLHCIGVGFTVGAVIVFNGVNLLTTRNSATDLSATITPSTFSSSGTFDVFVRQGGISTRTQSFTFTPAISLEAVLTSISPTSFTRPGPMAQIHCIGTGFISSAKVYVGIIQYPTTFVNSTDIYATIDPLNLGGSPGTYILTVKVRQNNKYTGSQPVTYIIS